MKEEERKQTAKLSRAEQKKLHLKPFIDSGIPPLWVNTFCRLGLTPTDSDDGAVTCLDNYKCSESPCSDGYLDWNKPAWFTLEDAKENSTALLLRKLVSAIGPDRIAAKSQDLERHAQTNDGAAYALVRCLPGNHSEFSKFEWVPDSLRQRLIVPEAVDSWGAPWILRTAPAHARIGAHVQPAVGCAGFLAALQHKTFVLVWPMAWTAQLNVPLKAAFSWLGSLEPRAFLKFIENTAWHCLLEPTEVCWIPSGHCFLTLALAEESSVSLWVPFANSSLMTDVSTSVMRGISVSLAHVLEMVQESDFYASEVTVPYKAWIDAAISARVPDDGSSDSQDDQESSSSDEDNMDPAATRAVAFAAAGEDADGDVPVQIEASKQGITAPKVPALTQEVFGDLPSPPSPPSAASQDQIAIPGGGTTSPLATDGVTKEANP